MRVVGGQSCMNNIWTGGRVIFGCSDKERSPGWERRGRMRHVSVCISPTRGRGKFSWRGSKRESHMDWSQPFCSPNQAKGTYPDHRDTLSVSLWRRAYPSTVLAGLFPHPSYWVWRSSPAELHGLGWLSPSWVTWKLQPPRSFTDCSNFKTTSKPQG